jgi:two-component system response regulator
MRSRIEILLVEDSPSDVRLTEEELKDSGLEYNLSVVNDGVEAMEFLNSRKGSGKGALPDVILLDLNMPKKNGHEVLKDISQDPVLINIPVVLLTVSQSDKDVLEALRLKMNYYLNKPVTSSQLRVLLKAIFELMSEETEIVGGEKSINEDAHVRLILASNPHTAPDVLTKLAAEDNPKLRRRVAENPHTPENVLVALSADEHYEVRMGVAENPKAPQVVLEKLAHDQQEEVRMALAEGGNMPRTVLVTLSEDDNIFVSTAAKKALANCT